MSPRIHRFRSWNRCRNDVYGIDMSVYGSVFEYPINKIDGKIDFKAAPFVDVYKRQISG